MYIGKIIMIWLPNHLQDFLVATSPTVELSLLVSLPPVQVFLRQSVALRSVTVPPSSSLGRWRSHMSAVSPHINILFVKQLAKTFY